VVCTYLTSLSYTVRTWRGISCSSECSGRTASKRLASLGADGAGALGCGNGVAWLLFNPVNTCVRVPPPPLSAAVSPTPPPCVGVSCQGVSYHAVGGLGCAHGLDVVWVVRIDGFRSHGQQLGQPLRRQPNQELWSHRMECLECGSVRWQPRRQLLVYSSPFVVVHQPPDHRDTASPRQHQGQRRRRRRRAGTAFQWMRTTIDPAWGVLAVWPQADIGGVERTWTGSPSLGATTAVGAARVVA